MLARKVKLKLNAKQRRELLDVSKRSADLYNTLLAKNFDLLDSGNRQMTAFDMINLCKDQKLAPNIGTDIIGEICKRVDKVFKLWLESNQLKLKFWLEHGESYRRPLKAYLAKKGKKLWGMPRFKRAKSGISIQFPIRGREQNRVKVFGHQTSINVPLIGHVKGFNDRQELVGQVKLVSIKFDCCGDCWATIICDGEHERISINSRSPSIGVDLGLKHTITAANDNEVIQPERDRFLDSQLHAIKRASRHDKKSLPCIHRKIARRRKHSHHVQAKRLLEAAQTVYVGNLSSKWLLSGRLARSASDAAHSQFLSILSYKALNAGKTVMIVNEAYTSQTCYACGKRQKMELSEREYFCSCGYSNDRDVNAALNILLVGERQRPEVNLQSPRL